jgi:type I restriction enzyme S subunit
MNSNYKRLGDFIEFYNIRAIELNKNLDIDSIRGISSISKSFIKTRANLVGVVADKYKVVTKNCFAYNPNTARMGDKIPIALNTKNEIVLVSSIYPTFKIVKTDELVPEYLMMWFKRNEFDRYARYKSHGSAREVFDIEEMNELVMPIPSIDKQIEIVREYETIQNRIALNNQMISKLEETAQAIYKQWFVDFEFPDENGKPYKSNGGEMVWCEELEKAIPEGWELKRLNDFIDVTNGYAFTPLDFVKEKEIPVIKISNINDFKVSLADTQYSKPSKQLEKYKVKYGDTLITLTGSHKTQINSAVGKVAMYNYKYNSFLNQRVSKINSEFQSVIYQLVKTDYFRDYLMNGATGSANQANISPDLIKAYKVLYPTKILLIKLDKVFSTLRSNILKITEENQKLDELKELLLAKMTRVESGKELIKISH